MGQSSSKLSARDVQALKSSTRYSEKEIKQMHKDFVIIYPTGIDEEKYCTMIKSRYESGDWDKFSHHMFMAIDLDRDGIIKFEEYVVFRNIEERGTLDQKINWSFRLYDVDHDGKINRKDMHHAISGMFMTKDLSDSVDETVDKLFEEMDKDKDGLISIEEFQALFRANPGAVDKLFR